MTGGPPQEGISRIALDVPLRRLFDYRVRAGSDPPGAGCRVRVPFGRRHLIGVVVEQAAASTLPEAKLKSIGEVLDAAPVVTPEVLDLIRWASDYYHHPIGEVIASALPKALRTGASSRAQVERWRPTPAGRAALGAGRLARAPAQRRLLEYLLDHDPILEADLDAALGKPQPQWRSAAKPLLKQGWVQRESVAESPAVATPVTSMRNEAPVPTPEQAQSVAAITAALREFVPFVLHGLTGSGKTEVYLQVIGEVLQRGRRALVLVPEIGLTPQLVRRFEQRLNAPLAVLHSALGDAERLSAWRAAASGAARIVVGTRSAVFAPVPDLGVIIVDEEHDASLKQHEGGFHYSARDLALVRAQRAQVPVVLGSATPSLETLQNVASGRYRRLCLPRRAGQSAPRLALVDLRAHAVTAGLSTPVLQAIERHLAAGGQVLVFLNRRGYAPTLLCTACGWVAPCSHCDARLTVHRRSGRLRCHHCGAEAALPKDCPQCGFEARPVGQGTERVEERLRELFAATQLVRVDRDAVRGQGDMDAALHSIDSGAARILVGTQMITKGHDFRNMTLVVVLNADQGLFSTDFRAAERLAQTIVQVAGRAGRGGGPGEVLIQTAYPEHPLLQTLLNEGYDGFARAALAERAASSWPPFSRLAVVRASATRSDTALEFLTQARHLAGAPRAVKLLGPVPAAMARRAGRYHSQLLLESQDRGALHRLLDDWLARIAELPCARRVRWALDVDPIDLF
jgi:primosomal protein N' (replication factor Y) (superfamily II helicase)